VIAEPLTSGAFRGFGHLLARPAAGPDATGPGWAWWAQTAALPEGDRPYAVGYLELVPASPTVDWAEQHERAHELIVPLGGDCVVYVAPPGDEPTGFRAFRVGTGTGVVLDPGVWHGAPLAIGRPVAAMVLLPQGTGTDDTVVARFPDNPIRIEV
jgi:ureidoglycolate hydrolase